MSSRGKCSAQIITQQYAANHDFAMISSITLVLGSFPVSEGGFRLEKISSEQNRIYILFFAVCFSHIQFIYLSVHHNCIQFGGTNQQSIFRLFGNQRPAFTLFIKRVKADLIKLQSRTCIFQIDVKSHLKRASHLICLSNLYIASSDTPYS